MQNECKYLRSLIETSLDPFVIINPDGKITDVNEATIKATGVSRDKLIGTGFSDYFTDPQKAQLGYKTAFEKGLVKAYELTIKHVDGSLMHVLYNATVYHDQYGKTVGVCATARDITSQKNKHRYLRSLIETSLDPFVTINPDGQITDVNDATIKATGVSRDELMGTDFSNYFTDPHKARQGYKTAFAKGLVKDYELTIKHVNGSLMHVIYNATVYHDQNGKIIGVFAAARDITHILKGILPICANCKKVRTDIGYWEQVEVFIRDHSNVEFSHSLCPECAKRLYPDFEVEK